MCTTDLSPTEVNHSSDNHHDYHIQNTLSYFMSEILFIFHLQESLTFSGLLQQTMFTSRKSRATVLLRAWGLGALSRPVLVRHPGRAGVALLALKGLLHTLGLVSVRWSLNCNKPTSGLKHSLCSSRGPG